MLRCAAHCLTACSVSLTQAVFGCFTLFYIYVCFTLFKFDYQIITKLNFFTLFERLLFYLVLYSFSGT
ncbi:MAG: hypothetical protein NZ455_01135, partial [Bacteroidia bacterium]|nr:hypothetical protein [Bacteroidia bacterium]